MKIAIGEAILSAQGAMGNMELAFNSSQYKWYFTEKTRLNIKLREIRNYKWDKNNFIEQTIWIPKAKKLLGVE